MKEKKRFKEKDKTLNIFLIEIFIYSRQATFHFRQWTEGIHRSEEPVSNTTLKDWPGVPIVMGP